MNPSSRMADERPRRSLVALVVAAIGVAVAAWLTQGTIALATPDGPRIALLPGGAGALAIGVGAGGVAAIALRAGASLVPLVLLAITLLPWIPAPVPAAFLVWAGSLRLLVWAAVAALVVFSLPHRPLDWQGSMLRRRPALAAGLLTFALYAVAAWLVSPSVPGGDEPHYLVITQSLLRDGDLKIEDNHRRGDYQAYFAATLRPDFLRRGRDGEIYSIHAPGISVLIAPAFAVGGYGAVVVFLLVLAGCAGALTWHVSWLATHDRGAAWFGWGAVTASATSIFHSFTVYPDGVGGLLALTGVWALVRTEHERETQSTRLAPWFLHGAALAVLPWLHTRFAFLAGGFGALVLLRLAATRNPAGKAVAFLAVPAVSVMCWIGYFIAIYGTPDPTAPYGGARQTSLAFIPGGLAGLLFDQRFGLVANAPVLICGLAGLLVMLIGRRSMDGRRRLALELLFVIVPYLLAVANFAMWWGGWSAPARFAAPVVPLLAIPCGIAWMQARRPATRVTILGALGLTVFLSIALVAVDGGGLAYNTRQAYALWLGWASTLTDLGRGLPAWFRDQDRTLYTEIAIWSVALGGAWLLLRALDRRPPLASGVTVATCAAAVYAAAGMSALTAVWILHGVEGTMAAPAQLELLRHSASARRSIGVELTPLRLVGPQTLVGGLQIEPTNRVVMDGGAGRGDRPILVLPAVPAGRYRVRPRTRGSGGRLMVGIAPDQFVLQTEPVASPASSFEVDFPVDVRALIVRGDEQARRVVRTLTVEPIAVVPATARVTNDVARRAARYGAAAVFFLDDRSFPEPDAFWIGGAVQSSIVVQPDSPTGSLTLFLRNAPVENELAMESGRWRETLPLRAGEERRLRIPLEAGTRAALVRFSSRAGFRPSAVDAASRDERFLGIWIRVEP